MKNLFLFTIGVFSLCTVFAQETAADKWVNKMFKKLSKDERIAQLMVVRLSTYDSKTKNVTWLDSNVRELVKKYNIGSICLFQGGPVKQATLINEFQKKAKTPILVCIDGEWGVGMRILDSVMPLPKQMMLGAMQNPNIVYEYGKLVAKQCKRLGIHVNYAPVIDINNNPDNPVINDRSFGEDKYKVAQYGIEYVNGLEDNNVMACVKHFPGHGDVNVDSHYDLPVINKNRKQLDELELYPFKEVFSKTKVGSIMIAHLAIPAIDNTPNKPTSISKNNVTDLLQKELKYNGISFTDALEMQGVKKFYPDGEASVQSIIAGNDMLCLPGDVPKAIEAIKNAIKDGRLSWADIDKHCKKVLYAKYKYIGTKAETIDTKNITKDLNNGILELKRKIAENAITLVNNNNKTLIPIDRKTNNIYLAFGTDKDNFITQKLKTEFNTTVHFIPYSTSKENFDKLLSSLPNNAKVYIGLHNLGRSPGNNFGISESGVYAINKSIEKFTNNAMTIIYGNAYALKNTLESQNTLVTFEDDNIAHETTFEIIKGNLKAKGKLPVTVTNKFPYGTGLVYNSFFLPNKSPKNLDLAHRN